MKRKSRIKRYGSRILIGMFVLVLLGGCGIYYFEKNEQPEIFGSFWGTIWWSIRTIGPTEEEGMISVTTGGQIAEVIVALAGFTIVITVAALLMYIIIETRFDIEQLRKEMRDDDQT